MKRNPSQGQFNKEISSKIDIDIVSCPNMICEIHGENRKNVLTLVTNLWIISFKDALFRFKSRMKFSRFP